MRYRLWTVVLLSMWFSPAAFAVPFDVSADFSVGLDPACFQIIAGSPEAVKTKDGKLLLRAQKGPAAFNFRYYPLRNGKLSRSAFGNFQAKLVLETGAQKTFFRWGVNYRLRDAVELEVDPVSRQARLLGSEDGKQVFTGEWKKLPPKGKDADHFTLLRQGNTFIFSAGEGKQRITLESWSGTIPDILDFSFKVPEANPGNQLAITVWRISPLPRSGGYSEIERRPGKSLEFKGDEGFENIGGNVGEGYIWSKDEKAEFKLRVGNPAREARRFILRTEVTDIDDRPVWNNEREISLQGGEERLETIEVPSGRYGYFNLRTRLFDGAGIPLEPVKAVGFAITAARSPHELSGKSVIGTHGYPFARNGAKHIRYWDNGGRPMFWSGIEARPGEWNFSMPEAYVNKTLAAGMTPLIVLAATPEWASTEPERGTYIGKGAYAPPKNVADWGNYCRRMAERFKGRVKHYEIWNEPNGNSLGPRGFFFHGDVKAYFELVKTAWLAIKEADPDALILAPSGTGNFFPFLDKFMELGGGDYFDILSIHTYCTPLPPEIGYYFNNEKNYLSRIERSREIMKKYGHAKPIWNTEIGYHSGLTLRIAGKLITSDQIAAEGLPKGWPNWSPRWSFRPLDPRRAAAFFTRFGLLSMVYGVERVYIHHRLSDRERDPYTALPAIGFLSTLFDGAGFIRRLPVENENLHLYEFTLADGRTAVAAWQVYPETLTMKRNDQQQLKDVDSAPVEGIADQRELSQETLRQLVSRPHYFEPGSRRFYRLEPSRKPDAIYDMWGNQVESGELERVGEMPLYLVFNSAKPAIGIRPGEGNVIQDAVPEAERLHGKITAVVPAEISWKPEDVLGKMTPVNLRQAEPIDGAGWNGKNWLELHTNQGIAFRPDGRFPKRGRLLLDVRSGKNINSFAFKYELKRNGTPIMLKQWPVFPLREVMRGKNWVLAAGYLISDEFEFSQDTLMSLHAKQGNSHIFHIWAIPSGD